MSDRFRLRWSPAAQVDLESIVDYILLAEGLQAAIRIHERLIGRIDTLEHLPARGRVVPELRAMGVTQFRELVDSPYRIIYRVDGKVVGLVAVLDARRDLEELLLARLIS